MAVIISPRFKQIMHRDLNLLITMIIGGLWHGPSENFVIWGAMNGVALVIYNYWKKISPYEKSNWLLGHFWKIFITFNFITFTRIWFRLKENGKPGEMLDRIVNHFDFSWQSFSALMWNFGPVFIIIGCGFFVHWVPQRWKDGLTDRFVKTPLVVQMIIIACAIVLMYQAVSDSFKPFVYFEF